MSVLKVNRKESCHAFVATWKDIGKDTYKIASSLSKRKGRFIEDDFIILINKISFNLTRIDEKMMKRAKTNSRETYIKLIEETYEMLHSFTNMLFVICFITKTKYKPQLENNINKEFMLLERILASMEVDMDRKYRIRMYDRHNIDGIVYLEKLEKLSDFTMSHVTSLKKEYNYSVKMPLQTSVSTAFRLCYESNMIMMNTIENIDERKYMLNEALEYLVGYEQTLWMLFSFSNFSNQFMDIWSGMLIECIKLIKSIIDYCNKERNKLEKELKLKEKNKDEKKSE